MSQLAQKLIAENKRTKSTFLDLGNCGLTELPEELFECTWLENLNLGTVYFDEKEHEFEYKSEDNKNLIRDL